MNDCLFVCMYVVRQMLTKGYRVAGIMPFDMFPQTRHIENVLTLIRDP